MSESKELTEKQRVFVEEYLVDMNATQACIRAGYSPRSAREQGYENLQKQHIQDAVAAAQRARTERTLITQDQVVMELVKIGTSDIRKIIDRDGAPINPHDWDDKTAASVASIEIVPVTGNFGVDEMGNPIVKHAYKVKHWDKNQALEKLGRHLAMFTDNLNSNLGVQDSFAALLMKAVDGNTRTKD